MSAPPIPPRSPLRKQVIGEAIVPDPLEVNNNAEQHYETLSRSIDEVLSMVCTQHRQAVPTSKVSSLSIAESAYSMSIDADDRGDSHGHCESDGSTRSSIDSSRSESSLSTSICTPQTSIRLSNDFQVIGKPLKQHLDHGPDLRVDSDFHLEDLEPLSIFTTDQVFDMIEKIPGAYNPGHHKRQFEEDVCDFSFRSPSAELDFFKIAPQRSRSLKSLSKKRLRRSAGSPRRATSLRAVMDKIRA